MYKQYIFLIFWFHKDLNCLLMPVKENAKNPLHGFLNNNWSIIYKGSNPIASSHVGTFVRYNVQILKILTVLNTLSSNDNL